MSFEEDGTGNMEVIEAGDSDAIMCTNEEIVSTNRHDPRNDQTLSGGVSLLGQDDDECDSGREIFKSNVKLPPAVTEEESGGSASEAFHSIGQKYSSEPNRQPSIDTCEDNDGFDTAESTPTSSPRTSNSSSTFFISANSPSMHGTPVAKTINTVGHASAHIEGNCTKFTVSPVLRQLDKLLSESERPSNVISMTPGSWTEKLSTADSVSQCSSKENEAEETLLHSKEWPGSDLSKSGLPMSNFVSTSDEMSLRRKFLDRQRKDLILQEQLAQENKRLQGLVDLNLYNDSLLEQQVLTLTEKLKQAQDTNARLQAANNALRDEKARLERSNNSLVASVERLSISGSSGIRNRRSSMDSSASISPRKTPEKNGALFDRASRDAVVARLVEGVEFIKGRMNVLEKENGTLENINVLLRQMAAEGDNAVLGRIATSRHDALELLCEPKDDDNVSSLGSMDSNDEYVATRETLCPEDFEELEAGAGIVALREESDRLTNVARTMKHQDDEKLNSCIMDLVKKDQLVPGACSTKAVQVALETMLGVSLVDRTDWVKAKVQAAVLALSVPDHSGHSESQNAADSSDDSMSMVRRGKPLRRRFSTARTTSKKGLESRWDDSGESDVSLDDDDDSDSDASAVLAKEVECGDSEEEESEQDDSSDSDFLSPVKQRAMKAKSKRLLKKASDLSSPSDSSSSFGSDDESDFSTDTKDETSRLDLTKLRGMKDDALIASAKRILWKTNLSARHQKERETITAQALERAQSCERTSLGALLAGLTHKGFMNRLSRKRCGECQMNAPCIECKTSTPYPLMAPLHAKKDTFVCSRGHHCGACHRKLLKFDAFQGSGGRTPRRPKGKENGVVSRMLQRGLSTKSSKETTTNGPRIPLSTRTHG